MYGSTQNSSYSFRFISPPKLILNISKALVFRFKNSWLMVAYINFAEKKHDLILISGNLQKNAQWVIVKCVIGLIKVPNGM